MRHHTPVDPMDALVTAGGALERVLPLERLYVPKEIQIDDGWLLFRGIGETGDVAPGPGLLTKFASLQDEAGVLAYARSWGFLLLCAPHGWPTMHTVNVGDPTTNNDFCRMAFEMRGGYKWLKEPISRWLELSAQVAAMLRLGIVLRENREPNRADWTTLGISETWAKAPRERRIEQRTRFADYVSVWTEGGKIRPVLKWENGRVRVELMGAGLFAALGLQLMAAIGDSSHIAYCGACFSFFRPLRRAPKQGQLSFCPRCRRTGAAARASVRASRQAR
jgi:hypothetical protein